MASEEIQLKDDVEENVVDNGILDTNSHISMLGSSDHDEGISRHVCNRRGESKESWGWFLHHLYMYIGIEDNRRVTFMSDMQKGVNDAIYKFWPRSNSGFCVRHLTTNMQAKYKAQLSGLFVWNDSNKSTKAEFRGGDFKTEGKMHTTT
ncbi:hypothetical protein EZV62_019608 [Acer yangbiense]|uniref:MULE transposase domain-containing protein n=1 Tax=Acer yangbiense TaxID=1000413 RepID=A0A5C7HD09_9ROSI|nr:hypothetical protein EZV62_019608 [Acer yangbiense]